MEVAAEPAAETAYAGLTSPLAEEVLASEVGAARTLQGQASDSLGMERGGLKRGAGAQQDGARDGGE